MHESNKLIYNLTNGRVHLTDIHIQLPASWASAPAGQCVPSTTISAPAWPSADVKLTAAEHPVFGDQPWSLQYDGCGQPAKYLTLPAAFLNASSIASTNQTNTTTAERLTVKAEKFSLEWATLKFGVFAESGFSGDNLYPEDFTEGLETLHNSGCSEKVQVRNLFLVVVICDHGIILGPRYLIKRKMPFTDFN